MTAILSVKLPVDAGMAGFCLRRTLRFLNPQEPFNSSLGITLLRLVEEVGHQLFG